MLRRTAFVLAILAIWPASVAVAAGADSNTASNLDSWSDSLSVLAVVILFVGLMRLVVPEKPEASRPRAVTSPAEIPRSPRISTRAS